MNNSYIFLWAQVSMVFMLIFVWFFVPTKLRVAQRILIMAVIYAGCTFVDYLQYFVIQKDITQIAQSVIEATILQCSVFILCKYKDFRALFTGLTAAVVVLVGNNIAVLALLMTQSVVISVICQAVIHSLILVLLIRFSRQNWIWLLDGNWKSWRELCSIPLLFWLIVYALTVWPQSIWEQGNRLNLLAVMFLLILLEASYVIMLAGISHQYHITEIERDNEYLGSYAAQLKREADRLREQESETAVIRHDLRHYLTQMQAYLAVGDIDEVNGVLEQLNQNILEITPKRYCDNLAVNGVITSCKALADQDKVKMTIKTEIPQQLTVNEFEFATVVSNLLENAVHAAAKVENPAGRYVTITVRGMKEKMMLEIKNSYAELPQISPDTGLPVSQNGKGHGYGLKSVLAFVRKNDAIFDYEIEDDGISVRMLV